ncbi:MAG: arsenate reductase ArsC [Spartobacteria bacterium]|nr:arsenate reductase ArsC [Spartobacteria bacterium]
MREKRKLNVLFLCTGNSCRSQMAEGLLNEMAGDRFEARSAGMQPAEQVHPMAVAVMREMSIDITEKRPKSVSEYLGKELIHFLIIVCNKANQTCPRIWPGVRDEHRLYWPFDDPAAFVGPETEKLEGFRRVRDEIKAKLAQWVESLDV